MMNIIVVGLPKQRATKKVRCPVCASRLCDKVVINNDNDKITINNDYDSDFIIKCHKCGQQIGIALVLNGA